MNIKSKDSIAESAMKWGGWVGADWSAEVVRNASIVPCRCPAVCGGAGGVEC